MPLIGGGRELAGRFAGRDNLDRWYNWIDPAFWVIWLVCLQIVRSKDLSQPQREFISRNIRKHRTILWINIIITTIYELDDHYWGMPLNPNELSLIVGVLIAPAFITGGAWFAITFGAIPTFLLDQAINVTFWMFLSFSASLNLMGLVLAAHAPMLITVIFYTIILSCLIASILYDNIDGLKIGLDQVLLKSGHATIRLFEALTAEKTKHLVDLSGGDDAGALALNRALKTKVHITVNDAAGDIPTQVYTLEIRSETSDPSAA